MSEWINPKYAELVSTYKQAQAESNANAWPEREDVPAYRIRSFVTTVDREQG
ncbi:hypothetical protein [Streptacidiphilus sp. P02-A3a]|uniref:hypothetical protein n=1 Tax=Streptacidiphilus sp. P02-A3a TaxID=2704468 RepID=UPI0015FE604A|nr:hypothetical protein [Streptacidiphilus sp. P02-A3a]QMU68659.1 hypothetical protein GXP74_10860 [Streptacidiphilus sp. P02-A3a]